MLPKATEQEHEAFNKNMTSYKSHDNCDKDPLENMTNS